MYEILLKCWYQENPNTTVIEVYNNLGFELLEDACVFLGENHSTILDNYPVESIEIKFNLKHKKDA